MKIGHYTKNIWENGGVASYIRRVSNAQRQAGHQVVYFDALSCRDAKRDESDQIEWVRNDEDLFTAASVHELDILHLHTLARVRESRVATVRTLHGHQPYCPSGSRFLKRTSQPCNRNYSLAGCVWGHVIDRCGSVRPQKFLNDFRQTWHEMQALRNMPVITVSNFLKLQMVQSGYQAHTIHVLHLPAPDVKEINPAPPKHTVPRFVFLGRLTRLKGLEWLLQAISHVASLIHLDIAGDGPEADNMRRMAVRLGISDRVTFHGWVNEGQVNALLGKARALVFPSLWHEPGGTIAFEAMINERAVIMSNVGGMPEVVHDKVNGLLVEPNDIHGLARAIECLATDRKLALKLGENGRRLAAESFSLPRHIERLTEIYQDCISQKTGRSKGVVEISLLNS